MSCVTIFRLYTAGFYRSMWEALSTLMRFIVHVDETLKTLKSTHVRTPVRSVAPALFDWVATFVDMTGQYNYCVLSHQLNLMLESIISNLQSQL